MLRVTAALMFLSACRAAVPLGVAPITADPLPPTSGPLRTPADFTQIADRSARSQALFGEAAKVLLHARCVNCHPADDSPRQGNPGKLHDPPVARGADGRGTLTLGCASCHQDHNVEDARVPGAPNWHLAPRSMVLLGRSVAEICAQMKDPRSNGNRTLAQIVDHSTNDKLVAWGWAPGTDRTPAPGTQESFGALMAGWVDTGADCPP